MAAPLYSLLNESQLEAALATPATPGAYKLVLNLAPRQGEPGVDYAAAGVKNTVDGSTDLKTWAPIKLLDVRSQSARRSNGDGTETVTMEVFVGGILQQGRKVFLRLNVSLSP